MTRRYYAPDLPGTGGLVDLSDDEARHAARVMRAQIGQSIILFDGGGRQSAAVIRSIDKRKCVVDAAAPTTVDREPDREIRLGIGFPKPERAKEMIERLTELGVKSVTPLICARTQRPPTESLLLKLRRIVIESCKQSQRNVLMEICAPVELNAFVANSPDGIRWIAHPDGPLIGTLEGDSQNATVLIGPEGGFTDEEVERAVESGYQKRGLGERIYRIETASVVVAAGLSNPM